MAKLPLNCGVSVGKDCYAVGSKRPSHMQHSVLYDIVSEELTCENSLLCCFVRSTLSTFERLGNVAVVSSLNMVRLPEDEKNIIVRGLLRQLKVEIGHSEPVNFP